MGVHAAVTVRAREFALARTLAVAPSARVTLEPVVPFGSGFAPAVRIRADDPDLVTDLVAAEADVRAVEPIDRGDDEALLGVEWDDRPRPIPATVTDAGGQCTEAVAVDGSWHLGLRFPTHDHVAAWYGDCRDRGIPVTIERVRDHATADLGDTGALTDPQREALAAALEAGFFEVPRAVTLEELGDRLGISDTAASQRLRRGITALLTESLDRPRQAEGEPDRP